MRENYRPEENFIPRDSTEFPRVVNFIFKSLKLGQKICFSLALINSAQGRTALAYSITTVGILSLGTVGYIRLQHGRKNNP